MNYTCESKGMMIGETTRDVAPNCEPPIDTMQNRLNDAICCLKELLLMMNDTSLALFSQACDYPAENMPDPKCFDESISCVEAQAHYALDNFRSIRKRIV